MHMQRGAPVGVAAFIGRARERAKIAELIAQTRLVTLTGSGGCGKTRLAVVVTEDLAPRFDNRVRWAGLQAVRKPGRVALAVAEAVGIRERTGQSLTDTLVEELREQRLLLVLDNCEHLVEECSDLVDDLLAACPQMHVLATSRVPLHADGEASFEVPPLPVPAPEASTGAAVASAEAARLFEVRARQVDVDFRIDDGNARAVAEVCRRLDGVPLAIELAAARVRALSPDQIAGGLSDRFALLTSGLRGAPARQRTLEASLDWSYNLLDHEQRLALARLSVFSGSFELDAAEAVVNGEGVDGYNVLDLITTLIEQSLLQVVERQGRARYRLLETIRFYARQRLSELDDGDRARVRHLAFLLELARRAQVGLASGRPEPWVARLTADQDDLRAAMDRAVDALDVSALVGLTEPIYRFWFDRAGSADVYRRLHEAVAFETASEDERVRGLTTAALLAVAGGRPHDAHRSAGMAVDAARTAHADVSLALALSVRAQAGAVAGLSTNEQIRSDVTAAIAHAEQSDDPPALTTALTMGGWTLLHSAAIGAAQRALEQAIDVCDTTGYRFHLPAAHAVLGLWPVFSGDLDRARLHARACREVAGEVGRPAWEAIGLAGLGAADILHGDHGRARNRLSRAQGVLRKPTREGNLYLDEFLRPWLALSDYAAGRLEDAHATAAATVRIARDWGSRWNESLGEWLLGLVELARDDGERARPHLEACRALSTGPCLPFPQGRSLLGLAELAAKDANSTEAWKLAHDALEILNDFGDRVGTAAALEQIAGLAAALGEPEWALRQLAASERFHSDTGVVRFPTEAVRFARFRETARAALEPAEAVACWDAGDALSLDDAVSYARRGRGRRQHPRTGWESLTPVESDVVRLVAAGLPNAEIGRRLFISVNTVKKHLSHVYEKVAVDGRADLAAQVARRDL